MKDGKFIRRGLERADLDAVRGAVEFDRALARPEAVIEQVEPAV